MGLPRLVTRRSGTALVLLGAAVSLGVVVVTASRFSWRRTRSEAGAEQSRSDPNDAPRFKPAPPRAPDAPRWDSPPAELTPARGTQAEPDPPSP
jgi:hypothetical protein